MAGGSYTIEGIGYDFIPDVLDRSLADFWIKTTDHDGLLMSRKLIRHEGLLCGGSCGTATWAACEVAKTHMKPGQRCVVILPDSTRNYMTKFLNDQWMRERGHIDGDIIKASSIETWWSAKHVSSLKLTAPVKSLAPCVRVIAFAPAVKLEVPATVSTPDCVTAPAACTTKF